ncbi:hypothetical protein SAMN03080617_04167 [Algoriphagus alkaliphilus]|uniref:Uncharacterized protein n=1 Tax=Algoriphagus alkaliphilus TaxID=279824 RepID=A0A1G5ZMH9_9BACT|nr:hypothetical protein [Algoriphagus alkaliphilus]SDA96021.1 hypothetical protein SAMN03080617_04167 [Algoriphagus alkaliphilus]
MNTFTLEIFDDEGRQCTFYTVRWEEADVSETNRFFEKYENESNFEKPIQELAVFLTKKIGNDVGAQKDFFRFENAAQALPPSGRYKVGEITINYGDFPLRLYCLRISDNLVVLFNGGEKTAESAQGGTTSMAFHEANLFAKRILTALQAREIYITPDERGFRSVDDAEEIFL